MKTFINANDVLFDDLWRRASHRRVVYHDRVLPPGSTPPRSSISIEVNASGRAKLLLSRPVTYTGSHGTVGRWLRAGCAEFPNRSALRAFLRTDIAEAFAGAAVDRSPAPSLAPASVPASATATAIDANPGSGMLTDLDEAAELLGDDEAGLFVDPRSLVAELEKEILSQRDALDVIAGVASRHLARTAPRRPASIFLAGPTGVGKTSTAEQLADAIGTVSLAARRYGFLRLDMSEYQEPHRVSQLLGAPPGYVGHGDGSELTDALGTDPCKVVLFDEIEKAHPRMLQALMNMMDAGRLSASVRNGDRTIDCRRAILLFTTNIDASGIIEDLARRDAFADRAVISQVCRTRLRARGVAPEIVGRIRSFAVFRPLDRRARLEVAALSIRRVGAEYGLTVVDVEPSVVAAVVQTSGDPASGARDEEYAIDDLLGAAFAAAAMAGGGENGRRVSVTGPPYSCAFRMV